MGRCKTDRLFASTATASRAVTARAVYACVASKFLAFTSGPFCHTTTSSSLDIVDVRSIASIRFAFAIFRSSNCISRQQNLTLAKSGNSLTHKTKKLESQINELNCGKIDISFLSFGFENEFEKTPTMYSRSDRPATKPEILGSTCFKICWTYPSQTYILSVGIKRQKNIIETEHCSRCGCCSTKHKNPTIVRSIGLHKKWNEEEMCGFARAC